MAENRIKRFLGSIFGKKEEAAPKTEAKQSGADVKPIVESESKSGADAKAKTDSQPSFRDELGDGYYLGYDEVRNGFGGFCDVHMRLYHKNSLIQTITDENGRFLNFPGVVHGGWENKLTSPFVPEVQFAVWIGRFGEDGLAEFQWTVQPDGRYWADEDGFGMTNDEEIKLISKFNKDGAFVTPFAPRQ